MNQEREAMEGGFPNQTTPLGDILKEADKRDDAEDFGQDEVYEKKPEWAKGVDDIEKMTMIELKQYAAKLQYWNEGITDKYNELFDEYEKSASEKVKEIRALKEQNKSIAEDHSRLAIERNELEAKNKTLTVKLASARNMAEMRRIVLSKLTQSINMLNGGKNVED